MKTRSILTIIITTVAALTARGDWSNTPPSGVGDTIPAPYVTAWRTHVVAQGTNAHAGLIPTNAPDGVTVLYTNGRLTAVAAAAPDLVARASIAAHETNAAAHAGLFDAAGAAAAVSNAAWAQGWVTGMVVRAEVDPTVAGATNGVYASLTNWASGQFVTGPVVRTEIDTLETVVGRGNITTNQMVVSNTIYATSVRGHDRSTLSIKADTTSMNAAANVDIWQGISAIGDHGQLRLLNAFGTPKLWITNDGTLYAIGTFSGNGSGLTNLTIGGVTGTPWTAAGYLTNDAFVGGYNLAGLSVGGTTTITRAMGQSVWLALTNAQTFTTDSSFPTNGDCTFSLSLYGNYAVTFLGTTLSNTVSTGTRPSFTNAWGSVIFHRGFGQTVFLGY